MIEIKISEAYSFYFSKGEHGLVKMAVVWEDNEGWEQGKIVLSLDGMEFDRLYSSIIKMRD
jgi:hypothetical protein